MSSRKKRKRKNGRPKKRVETIHKEKRRARIPELSDLRAARAYVRARRPNPCATEAGGCGRAPRERRREH